MYILILSIILIVVIVGIVLIFITNNSKENLKIDGIAVSEKMTSQDIKNWKHAQNKITNMLKVFIKILLDWSKISVLIFFETKYNVSETIIRKKYSIDLNKTFFK